MIPSFEPMVFVVDRANFRTFDPDRGYELFVNSGGSDGSFTFTIKSETKQFTFDASRHNPRLNLDEKEKLGPDLNFIPAVWVVNNWNAEWRPIIKDAMVAYLLNHGSPLPNYRAFVRFGRSGSIFDA